jgi:hypothetical protein
VSILSRALVDGLTGTWRQNPKPARMLTDDAVSGMGWVNPKLDSLGNAQVEIAARIGDTVIDIHEFTAMTPDVPPAKALVPQQYDSLKNGA